MVSTQSSVTEVEALQRKQAQFEEDLEAQVDRLDEVQNLAEKMIQQKHYDSDNIKAKSRALSLRYAEHFLLGQEGRTSRDGGSKKLRSSDLCGPGGGSCSSTADLVMKLWLSLCSFSSSCPAATR